MQDEQSYDDVKLDRKLIGKRIKSARIQAGYSQEQLALLCKCTSTHISNVERGKMGISLEMLFKLGVILDKHLDYFVMDSNQADPQIKINLEIAPKLQECNSEMLDMVDELLTRLIAFRNTMQKRE